MATTKRFVIRDQQEKANFWNFTPELSWCRGTEVAHIKTGDYIFQDMPDFVCIERKGRVAEFAQNVTQKRFRKELERMDSIEHPFVILEFDMYDMVNYPYSADLPKSIKRKIRINGDFLIKSLIKFQTEYKAKFILAGSDGKKVATRIFSLASKGELC